MAAVTAYGEEKEEKIMKRLLILLGVSVFLFFVSKSIVSAQSSNLTLRCGDFLNALPQGYVRADYQSKRENSFLCSFYNKERNPSGSESDVDIIPGNVDIRGGNDVQEQYEQKKNYDSTDKYSDYKIIAEDTVGEKSYTAIQGAFVISPTKGNDVKHGKTVFYQGPCYVKMEYSTRLNDSAADYHPSNPRTSRFDNLHPNFDHGAKRMKEEMEGIASNIAGICTNSKIIVKDNNNTTVRDTVTPVAKTEEERYNECVDKCFLNKVLSICSDNNSVSQCSFDLVNARKECLRTCKPPVQFRTPKTSDQGKIITQKDYGNQEVILLNGLPITNNSSVNSPFVSYSPVINKIDFELAKINMPQKVSEKNLEVWVAELKGDAQTYLATGSAQPQWIAAKTGDILPEGTRIFVAKDSSLLIGTDVGVLKVTGLSDLTITKATLIDDKRISLHIDLNIGTIEADVEKGQYQLDMQINTPSSLAKVKGTHFFVNFNEEKMLTQTGVFEGEMEVESLTAGQKLLLVPQSSGKFRIALIPLEVPIPTSTQEPLLSVTQKEQSPQTNGNGLASILFFLIAGGIVLYVLHKKGKLKPLYEKYKISEMIEKISKISKEEKKN